MDKRKVLAITTRVPMIGGKGDQLVAFHRLRAMREAGFDVHLVVCARRRDIDLRALEVLKAIGIKIHVIRQSAANILISLVKNAFGILPFQLAIYNNSSAQRIIREAISEGDFDFVYCSLLRPLGNIPRDCPPLVLDLVDSLALNLNRAILRSRHGIRRAVLRIEHQRLLRMERSISQSSHGAIVVSGVDKSYINVEYIHVIPIGVDAPSKTTARRVDVKSRRIIFSGNMSYRPNVEAAVWFIRQCMPKIRTEMKNVRLVVCGANPHHSLKDAARSLPDVQVTGRVEDIYGEISRSAIAIAPMMSGAGMQIKILEAMAVGVPVVTTRLGLGSIGACVGREVIVRDTAEEFSDAIVSLLRDEDLAREVGEAGREFVSRRHSWRKLDRDFIDLFDGPLR